MTASNEATETEGNKGDSTSSPHGFWSSPLDRCWSNIGHVFFEVKKNIKIMKKYDLFPAITVGLQLDCNGTNQTSVHDWAHSKLHCPDVAGACGAHCGCLGFQLKTTKRFQHVCWNHHESNSQLNHWWQIAVIMPAQHNQQTSSTFAWKHIVSDQTVQLNTTRFSGYIIDHKFIYQPERTIKYR